MRSRRDSRAPRPATPSSSPPAARRSTCSPTTPPAAAPSRRTSGRWPPAKAPVAKKLTSDATLFTVTVALIGAGLVMVWSASSVLAQELHGNAYHFLVRQVLWACLGVVVMIAAMRLDYRKLRHPAVVYPAV